MSFKKSVSLTTDTIEICKGLCVEDEIIWSLAINTMSKYFQLFVNELTPHFTKAEWNGIYCALTGKKLSMLQKEINELCDNVIYAYQHDLTFKNFIQTPEEAEALFQKINLLSDAQKAIVLYKANSFLRATSSFDEANLDESDEIEVLKRYGLLQ